ncbi:Transposon Tf2-6 polyprotein [Dictyocoela muelleri]|nr:Transposon Tf2-6 polyprotein [Dictyocoela muelleri]
MIKTCHFCQICKNNYRIYGNISGKISTNKPLEHISSDIYGPFDGNMFKNSRNINKLFIITFTDRCSRFTRIKFISEISAESMQKAFNEEWLNHFIPPKTILSDNGKCYISQSSKEFFNSNKIKQILTSPFNPTGNSIS